MALGTVLNSLGSTALGNANTNTIAHNLTGAVPAGATAVVIVASNTTGRDLTSVTDSLGNTWEIQEKFNVQGAGVPIFVASLYCPAGLASGTTVTATFPSNVNAARTIHATYFTGHGIFDRSAAQAGGPSTGWNSPATLPTTAAGEIAIGAGTNSNTNETNTTGSGPAATELLDTTNGVHCLVTQYAGNIAAGTAVNSGGSWAISNGSWLGVVVVFREYGVTLNDQAVWSLGQSGEGNVNTNTKTLAMREVPAGATAFAVIASTTSDRVLSSVTDSQGNSWSIDKVVAGSPTMHVASRYCPTGLPFGTVLTATWAAASITSRAIQAGYMAGNRVVDKTAASGATAAAWSSGATAAIVQSNSIAIGCATQGVATGNNNQTGSSPAMTELLDNPGGLGLVTTFAVNINSGVAVTAAGTWANLPPWRAAVVVYRILVAQTVEPTGIATAEAFGQPVVQTTAQILLVASVDPAEAFGSPQSMGQSVSPAGIASAEAVGSPQPLGQSVAPEAIASAEAVGLPTLVPGMVTVAPEAIASAEAVGSPSIEFDQVVSPEAIASAAALGLPTVMFGQTRAIAGIASAQAFGLPTLAFGQVVHPAGAASAESFGRPKFKLTKDISIQGVGIVSEEAFGSPRIANVLKALAIDSAEAFGAPTIMPGPITVALEGLGSDETFGEVLAHYTLLIAGAASAEAVGELASARHVVAPSRLAFSRKSRPGYEAEPLDGEVR